MRRSGGHLFHFKLAANRAANTSYLCETHRSPPTIGKHLLVALEQFCSGGQISFHTLNIAKQSNRSSTCTAPPSSPPIGTSFDNLALPRSLALLQIQTLVEFWMEIFAV
jgi:hypothetical protein